MKDRAGHGTHVAGTIGSVTWGIAKKTTLFAVRVLDSDGSGTNSGVIAGMNYVVTDAASRAEQCPNGFVANMSLGGRKVKAINDAVSAASSTLTTYLLMFVQAAAIVSSGIFLGVAAGNEGALADGVSPASEPSVCTVGATSPNDTLTAWSNYGPLVDILAPGLDITSTWIGGGIQTIDGTSMATPHVVGLAAYLLGLGAPAQGLCETIAGLTNRDKIDPKTLHGNTVNLLAYNHAEDTSMNYGKSRV
jgi:cerevisin